MLLWKHLLYRFGKGLQGNTLEYCGNEWQRLWDLSLIYQHTRTWPLGKPFNQTAIGRPGGFAGITSGRCCSSSPPTGPWGQRCSFQSWADSVLLFPAPRRQRDDYPRAAPLALGPGSYESASLIQSSYHRAGTWFPCPSLRTRREKKLKYEWENVSLLSPGPLETNCSLRAWPPGFCIFWFVRGVWREALSAAWWPGWDRWLTEPQTPPAATRSRADQSASLQAKHQNASTQWGWDDYAGVAASYF